MTALMSRPKFPSRHCRLLPYQCSNETDPRPGLTHRPGADGAGHQQEFTQAKMVEGGMRGLVYLTSDHSVTSHISFKISLSFVAKLKVHKREHFLWSISGLPQHFGSIPDSPPIIGADPDHPPGSGAGSTNCQNAVQRQLSALSDYASHGRSRAIISHSPVPGNTQLGPC